MQHAAKTATTKRPGDHGTWHAGTAAHRTRNPRIGQGNGLVHPRLRAADSRTGTWSFPRLADRHKSGNMAPMKSTIELADDLYRLAKSTAAIQGKTMRQFVAEALEAKLRPRATRRESGSEPPWMRGFGALGKLSRENSRIRALIDEEFERLEPEDVA